MSFVHWLQAVWLAIVVAQLVQLHYVRKQRKQLAAMVRTFERLNATLDSGHSEDKLI